MQKVCQRGNTIEFCPQTHKGVNSNRQIILP